MTNASLSAEVTQLHADLCSALSDSSRILILYALAEQSRAVNELAAEVGIPQSAASRHLKILRERGLVQARRQGMCVAYRLNDHRLIEALNLLRDVLRDSVTRRASLLEDNLLERA